MAEKILTLKEVAEILKVHPESVRLLIRGGALQAARIGNGKGLWRIRQADLDAYLDARTVNGTAKQQSGSMR